MPTRLSAKQRGERGEEIAARVLGSRGYRIIARNWRPGNALRGEIDCIAWTRGPRGEKVLAFIEVKTRSGSSTTAPQESVTPSKQRQIGRLANAYVSLHRLDETPCRFDVVEVWIDDDSPNYRCKIHRNAFEMSE